VKYYILSKIISKIVRVLIIQSSPRRQNLILYSQQIMFLVSTLVLLKGHAVPPKPKKDGRESKMGEFEIKVERDQRPEVTPYQDAFLDL
jgi:hypothetical protein